MREFSPAERLAAAELAREDLYFYTRWMFFQRRRFHWKRGPHHKTICDALTRVFRGQCRRLIINVAPRYSKTELAVPNFVSWAMGQYPDAEFIHTSYGAKLAAKNSLATREMLEHPAYREIFPAAMLDPSSSARDDWKTTAGGVMYATGSSGPITGFGAGKQRDGFGGAIIIDDPHKPDEAESETVREGVIEWFQNTLESRTNTPDTPIILIMQRLHERDLAGWLLNGGNGERWEHVCIPARNEDGTPLWPEKHSAADLARMEEANPYVFAGQYMQAPAPRDGGVFKPSRVEIVDALPAKLELVRGWDLAATKNAGDWTAGPLLGRSPDGTLWIADVQRERGTPDDVEKLLVGTAKRDGPRVMQSIPQDPGQAGKAQAAYLSKKLFGVPFSFTTESGDKATRAAPFAAQVNVGNVKMLKAPWNDALIGEMRMFPNGAFDDQIDGLSRAFNAMGDNIARARALAS
ncbi:phage terminase large subunit [Cupriavidus alkaliphilus]|uniref:phage terminase large subunit n=1 Tax=Cupriavidus alkaliphilus TaxID=942866 RepID=UPI00160808A4|nr:phage terminase large subunit [Cupriavidus alkaliphilus]MBB2918321.1 putative phage terminase large subunit-like protein [Cupriavidus alkaliphilus]